jgi:hypothetical protein
MNENLGEITEEEQRLHNERILVLQGSIAKVTNLLQEQDNREFLIEAGISALVIDATESLLLHLFQKGFK